MYIPHLIADIAAHFPEWKFGHCNQGSSITYYLETPEKYWDEEDDTFSIIEIAAYAKSEMAKRKIPIDMEIDLQEYESNYWCSFKDVWVSFDSTSPESKAQALIIAIADSLAEEHSSKGV